ncbi:MAG: DsbE family thiol:disulfide interchange protein [Gammaproteobacteria bacterium]|nr:DsbE family thiol:disulfide interchange protein [Gammaproteobacteria bacterium]
MKKQFMTPLIIFGLLVVLLVVGLVKAKYVRDVPSPLIGKAVPVFSIATVEDPLRNFTNKDLVGEVSLVNIWASWCVSCRAEHKLLNDIAKQGVKIYGINYKDELPDARRWLSLYGNPYVKSAHDITGRAGIDWGVYGTPETFVIDKKGLIRYKHTGPVYQEDITDKILPLIAQLQEEA